MESPKPLRILQVASHSNVRRGGAIQLLRLVQGLRRRGHRVECVFNLPSGKGAEQALQDLEFFEKEADCGVALFALEGRSSLAARLRFRRFVRAGGFDLIHAHRDEALVFAWTASWLAPGFPPIVAQRGTDYPLKRFRLNRAAFRSRRVVRAVAVSEAVGEALARDGVPRRKIAVIYGGVDLDRFHPAVDPAPLRAELSLPADRVVFANVASLAPKKGHEEFFQAAADVAKRIPNAVFLVAGDGNFRKWRPRLEALGLADRVRYLGFRRDVEAVLAAADVVVCSPTKGEGLTGVIREALAMGRPVVSTDVAGNREFIRDGETGRLVPPRDPQTLAGAMIQLVENPEEARAMARRGREAVLDLVDNDRRCERVEALYRDVVASRSTSRTE